MGIFKDIGKVLNYIPHQIEKHVSRPLVNKTLDVVGEGVSRLTGMPNAKERQQQQKLMNEQIAAYKEQTELAKQEMNIAKDSQEAEKRRIQEKQIRAVRRNSSMRGFLGTTGDQMDSGVNSKLGV